MGVKAKYTTVGIKNVMLEYDTLRGIKTKLAKDIENQENVIKKLVSEETEKEAKNSSFSGIDAPLGIEAAKLLLTELEAKVDRFDKIFENSNSARSENLSTIKINDWLKGNYDVAKIEWKIPKLSTAWKAKGLEGMDEVDNEQTISEKISEASKSLQNVAEMLKIDTKFIQSFGNELAALAAFEAVKAVGTVAAAPLVSSLKVLWSTGKVAIALNDYRKVFVSNEMEFYVSVFYSALSECIEVKARDEIMTAITNLVNAVVTLCGSLLPYGAGMAINIAQELGDLAKFLIVLCRQWQECNEINEMLDNHTDITIVELIKYPVLSAAILSASTNFENFSKNKFTDEEKTLVKLKPENLLFYSNLNDIVEELDKWIRANNTALSQANNHADNLKSVFKKKFDSQVKYSKKIIDNSNYIVDVSKNVAEDDIVLDLSPNTQGTVQQLAEKARGWWKSIKAERQEVLVSILAEKPAPIQGY